VSNFPATPLEQARTLENILVSACEGVANDAGMYQQLRAELMQDPVLRSLLPEFVRTCRDLKHFWGYIKGYAPKWEPRRVHVRDGMTPVFDHLEGANKAPVDTVASDVLQKFDADGVHAVWEKALARRHTDPDGAITSARTLLETVCKRILDEAGETYSDKDDLPAIYRQVALKLQIAPSQHTEDAFKRILGGATSVVEGLGSLRNKIGDAHGQGGKAVRPSARHAQLAVNLAGAMATFLVDTWIARKT
jgi:abortive infection Abi-like protein